MADMTITSPSVAGILSEAQFVGRGATAELTQRTATVAGRARRLVVPLAVLGVSTLVLWGAQVAEDAIQQAHSEQVARNAVLEQTLRSEQLRGAQTSLVVSDLEQLIATQLVRLESTDGFVK